jgi:hypothetical protein
MRHSTIEFSEHTVTKTAAPELMQIEVEKTRRAHQIGQDCGLFRVPKVLDHDATKGVAVFERIDDIEPIRTAVPWGERYDTVSETLGAAFAIIHRDLKLPEELHMPLPPEFALSGNEVCLHGDPSVDNVCIDKRSSRIVILDWQMTPLYGGVATIGTRFFDLMWFVNNLLFRPTLRYLFGNPVASPSGRFLESYFRSTKVDYQPEEITSYASRFFSIEANRMKSESRWRTRVMLPRVHVLTRKFISSLSAITP